MTDDKAKHRTIPSPPQVAKRKGCRWWIITALVLFISILCGLGYVLLDIDSPTDPYAYWKNLIAKDPRPEGVSEKEYVEKNRTGYCWRDRKFYKPEELKQKSMTSLSEKMLFEINLLKEKKTFINAYNEVVYDTDTVCSNHEYNCSLWFIPHSYTNQQWDKLFHTEINPGVQNLPDILNAKKINKLDDLTKYVAQYGNKGYGLDMREDVLHYIYGSDCCEVVSKQQIQKQKLLEKALLWSDQNRYFYESRIPFGIHLEDYGVGNFYLKTKKLYGDTHDTSRVDFRKNPTKQSNGADVFLLNNCGDLLWYPQYIL